MLVVLSCRSRVHTCCATTEVAPELYRDDSPVCALVQGHGSKPYGGGGGRLNPHSWGGGNLKPHGGGGGKAKPHSGAGGGNVGRVDMSTLYDMQIQAMCESSDRMNNII
ncbi:hypothetical protein Tco_0894226 [Tanacetum coccineum]|uniref:Uncharacterized protein n=1 Tax=Tanacetum coccineum TaxID=301880 RepID=A0ABQ5CCG2_9ASTR